VIGVVADTKAAGFQQGVVQRLGAAILAAAVLGIFLGKVAHRRGQRKQIDLGQLIECDRLPEQRLARQGALQRGDIRLRELLYRFGHGASGQ
jgi:hypothetical protein